MLTFEQFGVKKVVNNLRIYLSRSELCFEEKT